MGRDIGRALEDLSPCNFKVVKPVLGVSYATDGTTKKAEDCAVGHSFAFGWSLAHARRARLFGAVRAKTREI